MLGYHTILDDVVFWDVEEVNGWNAYALHDNRRAIVVIDFSDGVRREEEALYQLSFVFILINELIVRKPFAVLHTTAYALPLRSLCHVCIDTLLYMKNAALMLFVILRFQSMPSDV